MERHGAMDSAAILMRTLFAILMLSAASAAAQFPYTSAATNAPFDRGVLTRSGAVGGHNAWRPPSPQVWTNNSYFIWLSGYPAPNLTGSPGPPFFLTTNGNFIVGTNATQDIFPLLSDFSTIYFPYAVSLTASNEPAQIGATWNVVDSEDYNFWTTANVRAKGKKDSGIGFIQIDSKLTNGSRINITLVADPSGLNYGADAEAFAIFKNNSFESFGVRPSGNLILAGVEYIPSPTNGTSGQVMTTDGGTPQQLSWTTASGGTTNYLAAGTNINLVTNGPLVTISVANTNLPAVSAGTNIVVSTNGLNYKVSVATSTFVAAGTNIVAVTNAGTVTISVATNPVVSAGTNVVVTTNGLNYTVNIATNPVVAAGTNITISTNGGTYTVSAAAAGSSIGPGTSNRVAIFSVPTNVIDSVMLQGGTNEIAMLSRATNVSQTNQHFFKMYKEWTSPINFAGMTLSTPVDDNSYYDIHPQHGASYTTGDNPLRLWDTWIIEGTTARSGHATGSIIPTGGAWPIGSTSAPVGGMTTDANGVRGSAGMKIGMYADPGMIETFNSTTTSFGNSSGSASSPHMGL